MIFAFCLPHGRQGHLIFKFEKNFKIIITKKVQISLYFPIKKTEEFIKGEINRCQFRLDGTSFQEN